MPRNKRGNIKLRHEQAANALKKALGYINELYETFLPVHPQYAEGYKNICLMITQAIEFTEEMNKHV